MPLHRLTAPSYFGGLPGTHDYINDPAANGDPGAAAPADGKKGSAVAPGDQNEGTYFVAFMEPAQAQAVNRPAMALAENTDFLDDIVHRDIAVPAYYDVSAGHGGTQSFVLPGDVWLGDGVAGSADVLAGLIQFVIPNSGAPLTWLASAGPPAQLATPTPFLIHDGALASQVGNGFVTNPTVLLANTIPTASAFRVLYTVRGRLKDMPQGSFSGLRHWPVGLGNMQVQLGNLAFDAAQVSLSNTFSGSTDQTFLGPVHFGYQTLLEKTATVPAFKSTVATLKRLLVDEFRVNESPDVFFRSYILRDSAGVRRGMELTYNAKWTSDSAPEWASDSTSTNFHPTRYRFLGAGASFAGEGFFYEVLDNGTLGAGTWNETVWSTSPVRSSSISNGAFVANETRSAVPILDVPFDVTAATDDAADNPYKLLIRAATLTTKRIRVYSGDDDDAGGTGGLGQLIITHNAVWNPSTRLWSLDDAAQSALALCFRTTDNPNPGISGLSGSSTPGSDSHGGTALVLLVKNAGAGTWSGQSWTKASGSSGHLRIAGEYSYASSSGKEMRHYINPFNWMGHPSSTWVIVPGGLGASGGAATGVFWSATASGEYLYVPLDLPYGAKIISFFARVDPITASAGNRMKIQLFEQDVDTLDTTVIEEDETDGTGNIQSIGSVSGGLPHYVQDDKVYFLRIRHALGVGIESVIRAHVGYLARVNAPGPGQSVGFAFVP